MLRDLKLITNAKNSMLIDADNIVKNKENFTYKVEEPIITWKQLVNHMIKVMALNGIKDKKEIEIHIYNFFKKRLAFWSITNLITINKYKLSMFKDKMEITFVMELNDLGLTKIEEKIEINYEDDIINTLDKIKTTNDKIVMEVNIGS